MRSLFSPQDLTDLEQLINPIPDDIEELSKAIATWCKQEERSQILKTLVEVRQTLSSSTFENVSDTTTDSQTSNYSLNKQTLQNALQQNSFPN